MNPATYQTVSLSRGKHQSPEGGACVMELASMLAGEPFSDHPTAVCRVIGALLRAYNDSIDDAPRQDLYEYAAKVIGSRAGDEVEMARAARIVEWTSELSGRRRRDAGRFRRLGTRLGSTLRAAWPVKTPKLPARDPIIIAHRAVRETLRHKGKAHHAMLALVDELLEIGHLVDRPAPPRLHTRSPLNTIPSQPVAFRELGLRVGVDRHASDGLGGSNVYRHDPCPDC